MAGRRHSVALVSAVIVVAVLAVGGLLRPVSVPEPPVVPNTTNQLVFRPVRSGPIRLYEVIFDTSYWSGQHILINGQPKSLRAVARYPAAVDTWPVCSGTLIGEHVLLFAAHCLDKKDDTVSVETITRQTSQGRCTRIEDRDNAGALTIDLALCNLADPINDTPFETLATDAQSVAVGDNVILTGYGVSGKLKGQFSEGRTRVARLHDGLMVTDNDVYTTPGDSGAAAYKQFNGKRVIIGVNRSVAGKVATATLIGPAKARILEWQSHQANTPHICGIDKTC